MKKLLIQLTLLILSMHLNATVYYASPTGTNAEGTTKSAPGNIMKMVEKLMAGDELILLDGQYDFSESWWIDTKGTPTAYVIIRADENATPILDFRNQSDGVGVQLWSEYTHLKGITIRYADYTGIYNYGSYNILERLDVYGNCCGGIQHGYGGHNMIINCDSHDNFDYKHFLDDGSPDYGGNADGFYDGLGEEARPANVYIGCRAWNNSDDGFDFFMRLSEGKPSVVINCIAYNNGPETYDMTNHPRVALDKEWFVNCGETLSAYKNYGNGNGFKLGGYGTTHNVELYRCLAVGNRNNGFDQNENAGKMKVINCMAYQNGQNYGFYRSDPFLLDIHNCISLEPTGHPNNHFWAGELKNVIQSHNSWNDGFSVSASDFESVDVENLIIAPRNADGSLPETQLFKLKSTALNLIDEGTIYPVSNFEGDEIAKYVKYNEAAPDLGCYEYEGSVDITTKPEMSLLKVNYEGLKDFPYLGLFSNEGTDATLEMVADGVAITNPRQQDQIENIQSLITDDCLALEKDHSYIVRLTLKVPSDGSYQIQLGNWDTCFPKDVPVTAGDGWQVIDVEFPDFDGSVEGNGHVVFQNGWVVGTTILKKVEVLELKRPTIKAKDITINYGDDIPELAYKAQWIGGELDGIPNISTTATKSSPAGTYPIKVEKGTVTNENVIFVDGTLTITKIPLTIGVKSEIIAEGDDIPKFTLIYDGFKNGDTEADAFTKKPVAETTATKSSPVGTYPITVSGGDAQNYTLSYTDGILNVMKEKPKDGDVTVLVDTSMNAWHAGGICATGFAPAIITSDGRKAQMMETYEGTVARRGEMMYQTVSGLENGDYVVEVYANALYTDGRGFDSDLKDGATDIVYVSANDQRCYVTAHVGTAVSENGVYTIPTSVSDGTLRISLVAEKSGTNWHTIQIKRLVRMFNATVTANNLEMTYGSDVPELTYTTAGKNVILNGIPKLSTTATKTSPVGTYPIVIERGTVTNGDVGFVDGTLTITKAPLTVCVEDVTITRGEAIPSFSLRYEGLQNDETENVAFTEKPTISSVAQSNWPVGIYDIYVTGGEAPNYELKYQSAEMTILPAPGEMWHDLSFKRQITHTQPMTGIVLRPGTASEHHTTYGQCVQLEYEYYLPSEIVKGCKEDGTIIYDWSSFDDVLSDVASRGHQLIPRFRYIFPNEHNPFVKTAVPDYIKQLPDYHETYADVEGEGSTYYPDWSNAELQRFTLQFYTDFFKRYAHDPRLAFLQVGFGHWAEYHIYPTPVEYGKNFPSLEFQKKFLIHMSEVSDGMPWLISKNAGDNSPIPGDDELLALRFGLFEDSFMGEFFLNGGYKGAWNGLGGENRWQIGAVGGEAGPAYEEFYNFLNPEGMYGHFFEDVASEYHVTFMGGSSALDNPNGTPERIKQASMATGYRFVVKKCSTDGSKTMMLVGNEGIAPIYRDAYFAVGDVRSETSLKGLLPNEEMWIEIAARPRSDGSDIKIVSDYILPQQEIEFEVKPDPRMSTFTVNEVVDGNVVCSTAGEGVPDVEVAIPYRRYQVKDGKLYFKAAADGPKGLEYNHYFTLTTDGQIENIDYNQTDVTGVVFLSEAEDIPGMTLCDNDSMLVNCSNGAAAYAANSYVYFATLPAGTYQLTAFIHDSSKSPDSYWSFQAGNKEIAKFHCTSVNNQEFQSDVFTLTQMTKLYILQGGNKGQGIDLIYVTGTMKDGDATALVDTSQSAWNAGGICATEYAPAVVTSDGRSAQMVETYEGTVATTGEMMYQTVSGLENGDYVVEVYANAQYTDGRGFDSDLKDGATDIVYVSANDQRCYVTAHVGTAVSENGVYTIPTSVSDGTLRISLVAEKSGTNWHTIQIKRLVRIFNTTVTANNMEMTYGSAVPELTYTTAGKNVILNGIPKLSTTATKTSPVGTYPIIIERGTVNGEDVGFVDGTLTITKAPLTITADNKTKKQGEAMPELTATYKGFKNKENAEVLTKQPTFSCKGTATSAPGTYPITVKGATAQNYDISFVNGTLTVVDADAVVVTAKDYTIEYGDELPEFGYTSEGVKLTGTPKITCEAKKGSPAGTYEIAIAKGSVSNYNDTYVNGTLTITKAPLTVGVKSETITEGDDIPQFTLTYKGFKNGDTEADAFTKKPVAETTATKSSLAGTYPITVSGGEAQNYTLSYTDGTLTIEEGAPKDEDLTARVATSQSAWNAGGVCATEYAPAITTSDGRKAQMMETYEESVATTGEMMYQTISGLENGDYAVELYANAQYTDGRGFDSSLKDGDTKAVYVSANDRRCYVTAHVGTAVSENGVYTVYAHVNDGTLRIGLTAEKPGTNWHTLQIKKLTLLRVGTVVYSDHKTREQGEANPEWTYTVSGAQITGKPAMSCTVFLSSAAGCYEIKIRKGSVKSDLPVYYQPGVMTVTVPLGIGQLSDDEQAEPIFDLQGRRVDADILRKGLYIQGGKVVVRGK